MGSSLHKLPLEYLAQATATANENNTSNIRCQPEILPKAKYTADNIEFIRLTIPMSNYIVSMISNVQQLFGSCDHTNNAPTYSKTIKQRLENFNKIQQNICENKYGSVGAILKDIDLVWQSMYELTNDETENNKISHDPKSDFITFAAGIESEFYNLWEQFEQLLIKQNYLKKDVALTTHKYLLNNNNNNNTNNNKANELVQLNSKEKKDMYIKDKATDSNKDILKDWLTNTVELPQYYDTFFANGFTDMTFIIGIIRMDDLKEMGISKMGHRRKILHYADSPENKKRKLNDMEINDEIDKKNQNKPEKRRRILE